MAQDGPRMASGRVLGGDLGGSWGVMGGGETPFLTGDVFTVTDTFATADSVIQKWLWRGYGASGYLPSSGAPTITDP